MSGSTWFGPGARAPVRTSVEAGRPEGEAGAVGLAVRQLPVGVDHGDPETVGHLRRVLHADVLDQLGVDGVDRVHRGLAEVDGAVPAALDVLDRAAGARAAGVGVGGAGVGSPAG